MQSESHAFLKALIHMPVYARAEPVHRLKCLMLLCPSYALLARPDHACDGYHFRMKLPIDTILVNGVRRLCSYL